LRACGPAVIVASGHLSPRLAELTEFLLAATILVTRFYAGGDGLAAITDQAQQNSEYVRRLLKKNGLNSPRCLNRLVRAQLPVLTPLVLSGAAPDTSIAAFQRPPQTRSAYRARSADLLGFIDLEQRGT